MAHADCNPVPFVAAISLLALSLGCGGVSNEYVAPPPPDVTVATPVQHPVTQFVEENGETEASERAEVRSRVRGFVESIEFEPGQTVTRDTLLYKIEDAEYVAAVNSAIAEVAVADASIAVAEARVLTAEAEANRADREWKRQQTLLGQQATSQTEYDQARAANEGGVATLAAARSSVEAAKATRRQAQAKLDKAQLDLGYTRITAPIDGRVTSTDVKLGNLVENGTAMSVVLNNQRVYVNFTISDRQAIELQKAQLKSENGRVTQDQWASIPVYLRRESDTGYPFQGVLNYVDQEGVSVTTGTLRLRAILDNPEGRLLPGLFVRVRVPVATRQDALLVPAQAVLRDRVGAFLMVVGAENRAERREVSTGEESGGWIVIDDGLAPEDRVIIAGSQRARPGAVVNPIDRTLSASDLPAAFTLAPGSDRATDQDEQDQAIQ
jgi:RND family efflux transporter MFP subunit